MVFVEVAKSIDYKQSSTLSTNDVLIGRSVGMQKLLEYLSVLDPRGDHDTKTVWTDYLPTGSRLLVAISYAGMWGKSWKCDVFLIFIVVENLYNIYLEYYFTNAVNNYSGYICKQKILGIYLVNALTYLQFV